MVGPVGKPNRQEKPLQENHDSSQSSPALWVAATPIGNLGDVTERLRQTFASGRTFLCEDTRRTLELCRALGIEKPGRMERCDAHSRDSQVQGWVRRAQEGERFILVTDAGTPGISDPGAQVVRAFAQAGLRVEALPGPSAVVTALSLSGFEGTEYAFWGFFPRSTGEQSEVLDRAAAAALQGIRVQVWFDSPERIVKSLEALQKHEASANLELAVFRELSKRFETAYRGTVAEVLQAVKAADERGQAKGEWVLVTQWIESPRAGVGDLQNDQKSWEIPLKIALRAGASTSAAAREVASEFGVERSVVYQRAVQLKKE
jgi:16S rRNA (cytidine1402-2'-O)-methyltransferase